MSRQEDLRTNTSNTASNTSTTATNTTTTATNTGTTATNTATIATDQATTAAETATTATNTTAMAVDTLAMASDLAEITIDTGGIGTLVAQVGGIATDADRRKGSQLITQSVRTASFDSGDVINNAAYFRGMRAVINVTELGASQTVTVQVQNKDTGTNIYVDVPGAVTPAISSTGTTLLAVYPGITPIANEAVSDMMPTRWRFKVTLNNGTNCNIGVHQESLV